ncbi:MAG TPA: hexose kinase [Streptosporangiaceae bacterium]|nr:hexose kinase [Streptosporangiaceae bacterium]
MNDGTAVHPGFPGMDRRILVVALNPALDITHELPTVDWSGVNRPAAVMSRPGGKGLNVARTLAALGADVLVAGLTGGRTGEAVGAGLAGAGVRAEFTPIAGETRRTFAVVDTGRGRTALFNEPGPEVTAAEYARFRERYEAEAAAGSAVVLSGSLPRGLPESSYAELIKIAAAIGVPVVLDTSGPALPLGAAAGPAIVKPNLAELSALVGWVLPDLGADETGPGGEQAPIVAAAAGLRAAGVAAVVVSLGAGGLLAVTGDGVWRATQPRRVAGNPTGAGDAVVAGLTLGLAAGRPWSERLRQAVALGYATAAAPVAGEFGRDDYERALAEATVTGTGVS